MTVLLNCHICLLFSVRCVLGDMVRLGLSSIRVAGWSTHASACNTGFTQTQPYQISNTQRTDNKMTNVVIQQHSRKLLMMDILMSQTCWVHKKLNKTASDIKLVLYSSTINSLMLHIRIFLNEEVHTLSQLCLSNTVIILYTLIQHNIITSVKTVSLHNLGMMQ